MFRLKFLRRWRIDVEQTGDDIIITSHEIRNKPVSFWVKAYLSTAFAWTARFGVVNALMMADIPVSEHLIIYARQIVMWVILLISPTSGSSGVAEYFFSLFLGGFIGTTLGTPLAILWRLITYYPYVFNGILVLPHWIRRVYFFNRRSIRFGQQ
ncbi:MAG TPA: lysylphosphatidylglycerol synthase domain-containing protein [Bacteroidales bacterium]|nr:lysylphosphatidylglycerol synthase domain-containing protein [Bacteroidales bacterium]